MAKHRLCIDIDNVVAETDQVMRDVIGRMTKGRVQLAYEDIVEFDYQKCRGKNGNAISDEEWEDVHDEFSEPRNLWLVRPVEGIQGHLQKLATRYVLHFATSRKSKARKTTVEWLENHGFPDHDIHFVKHGEKHASLGSFHAAVEDHYEQATSFAASGTPCYLIRHPWNQSKPEVGGVFWIDSWSALTEELLK